jgi:hypothetical protein
MKKKKSNGFSARCVVGGESTMLIIFLADDAAAKSRARLIAVQ